ncbi:MAG: PaaI family thioesterase [Thermodesulfobacteriota bacterium]
MHEQVCDFFRQNDQLGKYLGINVEEVGPGFAKTSLTLRDDLLNGAGMAHGATIFALADIAFGAAANSRGELAIGIEAHVSYIRPGKDGMLHAEAHEIGANSKTATYKVIVTDEKNTVLASFQGTAYKKNTHLFDIAGG